MHEECYAEASPKPFILVSSMSLSFGKMGRGILESMQDAEDPINSTTFEELLILIVESYAKYEVQVYYIKKFTQRLSLKKCRFRSSHFFFFLTASLA